MRTRSLGLDGVVEVEYDLHEDNRGWFVEVFDVRAFENFGLPARWPHDSVSYSESPGTIRGLHYQAPPFEQAKIVTVAFGNIFDVVVDIRPSSETYFQHLATGLSPGRALFVPEGFAHGYCTLVPETVVIYKMTQVYSPAHAKGIRWDDPDLGIEWPAVAGNPTLSSRDRAHPPAAATRDFDDAD